MRHVEALCRGNIH